MDKFTPETAHIAFNIRCPYLTKNDKCSETERPSGRIKTCLRESGLECDDYNAHCPECGEELEHSNGTELIPEHDFCPTCRDTGYMDGKPILKLEG